MKELNELVELAIEFDASTTAESAMAINSQFKATATRETILAIAEAFRALEQRAEAAEAKLAEYEKQEPVDFRWRWASDENAVWTYCHMDKFNDAVAAFGDNVTIELVYSRPAPAADLAELVPSEWSERAYDDKDIGYESGWNDCIAAILRNIEEAK
jgi:hypothetical protein